MSRQQYEGLPLGEWERPSGRREITPNGWRTLTACTWPGGGVGLYLHQWGCVGWATAVGSFVVFDIRRIVYIGHARRVILWTVHTEDRAADIVQRVARALEAHPGIAEKILTQATIDPEWERAVRYLSLVYRTRDLDAGMNWDCLLNFALTSAASIAWTLQQAERAAAAEPTVTPEDTLRAAGISGKRQAAYQRKMSTLLAGRQTAPIAEAARERRGHRSRARGGPSEGALRSAPAQVVRGATMEALKEVVRKWVSGGQLSSPGTPSPRQMPALGSTVPPKGPRSN